MSDQSDGWLLAETDLDPGKVGRVRRDLPSPKKLRRWRDDAERRGIDQIDLWDLAIEREGLSDRFNLEIGDTSTPVGQVLRGNVRGSSYRLLWLIDGTTYELIEDPNCTFRFFADGSLIGHSEVVGRRKFLWFFRLETRWSVHIGEEPVFEYEAAGPGHHMRITLPDELPCSVWVGKPLERSIPHPWRFPLWKAAGWSHRLPNDLWFLPRMGRDFRIDIPAPTRLGLLAFAMANRRARSD